MPCFSRVLSPETLKTSPCCGWGEVDSLGRKMPQQQLTGSRGLQGAGAGRHDTSSSQLAMTSTPSLYKAYCPAPGVVFLIPTRSSGMRHIQRTQQGTGRSPGPWAPCPERPLMHRLSGRTSHLLPSHRVPPEHKLLSSSPETPRPSGVTWHLHLCKTL